MSLSVEENLNIDHESNNQQENNILNPFENKENEDNNNQSIKSYNYKKQNSSFLNYNQKYLSPTIKDKNVTSPIYPILKSDDNYPYYFKYSNSNKGDDFNKTKKYYSYINKGNQLNHLIEEQKEIPNLNLINQIYNEDKEYNNILKKEDIFNEEETNENKKIEERNNYNNWYIKFKNSNFFNKEKKENKFYGNISKKDIKNEDNLIGNDNFGINNNKEKEIIRKYAIRSEKEYFLQNEINNLYIKLKQINNQSNSVEPYFFKNKYADLFK